jgi:Spy/CpxP family protein refolding chaperone
MERAFGLGGDQGHWWNRPKVIERLKLTEDQRKAMDGILLAHREKLIDLRASVERAELEMEPLLGADRPDESRILSQIDKVAQARAELEKANARFLLAIRNKLTPEQWKQVQQFRADHGPMRHGRDGGQWPDGHGPNRWNPGSQPPPQNSPQGAEPQGPATSGTGAEQ